MKGASRCDEDNAGMAAVASSAPSNDNCNFFTYNPLPMNLVSQCDSKETGLRMQGDMKKMNNLSASSAFSD